MNKEREKMQYINCFEVEFIIADTPDEKIEHGGFDHKKWRNNKKNCIEIGITAIDKDTVCNILKRVYSEEKRQKNNIFINFPVILNHNQRENDINS